MENLENYTMRHFMIFSHNKGRVIKFKRTMQVTTYHTLVERKRLSLRIPGISVRRLEYNIKMELVEIYYEDVNLTELKQNRIQWS
jgi:hypothetical protein